MSYYQQAVCNYDVQWAIDQGWSAPPVCKIARVTSLDLSGVHISGGDFNQRELEQEFNREANLHRIALITSEELEGPTVVFTPSVSSAKGVAHYLTNNYGIPATSVYGTQPEEERNDAIGSFKAGRLADPRAADAEPVVLVAVCWSGDSPIAGDRGLPGQYARVPQGGDCRQPEAQLQDR